MEELNLAEFSQFTERKRRISEKFVGEGSFSCQILLLSNTIDVYIYQFWGSFI